MAEMTDESYISREEQEAKDRAKRTHDLANFGAGILMAVKVINDRSPEAQRGIIRNKWNEEVTKRVLADIRNDPNFKKEFRPRDWRNEDNKTYQERRRRQALLRKKIVEDVPNIIADLSSLHGDQIYDKNTTEQTSKVARELIEQNHPNSIVAKRADEAEAEKAQLLASIKKAQTEVSEAYKAKNDDNNARYVKKHSAEELVAVQAQELQQAQAGVMSDREYQKESQKLDERTEAVLNSDLSRGEKKEKLREIKKAREEAIVEAQVNRQVLTTVLTSPDAQNLTPENFAKLYQRELDQTLQKNQGWGNSFRNVDRSKLQQKSQTLYRHVQSFPRYQRPVSFPPRSARPNLIARSRRYLQPQFNFGSWRIDFRGLSSLLRSTSTGMYESLSSGISNVVNFFSSLANLGGSAAKAGKLISVLGSGGALTSALGGLMAAIGGPLIVAIIVIFVLAIILLIVFANPITTPQALIDLSPTPIEVSISATPSSGPTPLVPYKTAGANLEEVMEKAAAASCTPLAMIKAISRREASTTWNYSETQFGFYNSYPWWNSSELTEQSAVCTGFGYNTCTNQIPTDSKFGSEYCKSGPVTGLCRSGAEVMGPMQFERGTWEREVSGKSIKSQVEAALAKEGLSRSADRRVILDAFIGSGIKLHADSKANSCTDWTPTEIAAAAGAYYGKCEYTIGMGGNYCQEVCDYYNEYSDKSVDCSKI